MKTTSSTKRYSGREFLAEEIAQIRRLIQIEPGISRQQLSYRVCEVFDWRKLARSISTNAVSSPDPCRLRPASMTFRRLSSSV